VCRIHVFAQFFKSYDWFLAYFTCGVKLLVIFFWHFSSNRKIWSSQWICFSEQLVCCVYLKLLRAIYSIRVTNSNSTIWCKIWLAMYASEQPEGNIFVLFVLTELPQWWNHVQVSRKKLKNLFLKQKENTYVIHRCALPSRTLSTLLKNVLDFTR